MCVCGIGDDFVFAFRVCAFVYNARPRLDQFAIEAFWAMDERRAPRPTGSRSKVTPLTGFERVLAQLVELPFGVVVPALLAALAAIGAAFAYSMSDFRSRHYSG